MREFELRVTDKEIPAWGGMGLMKRMRDHRGFHSALRACGLPHPGRHRGYRPAPRITQFRRSVWCGAKRFEHGDVTRHDPVLSRRFGVTRRATFNAVMRLVRRFTQHTNASVMASLSQWMFGHLAITGLTLDSFNMKDFWATEATLNTVMLAYNLMSLMRQVLLKGRAVKHSSNSVQHTLQTLRYKLFAKAAYSTTESRQPILNLALARPPRAWMQGVWDAAKPVDLPANVTPVYSP